MAAHFWANASTLTLNPTAWPRILRSGAVLGKYRPAPSTPAKAKGNLTSTCRKFVSPAILHAIRPASNRSALTSNIDKSVLNVLP